MLSASPLPTQSHKAVKLVALPWRLPKTLPHTIYGVFSTTGHSGKMESKQFYLIHRNKHGEAAKLRRQRNMAQMKEQNKVSELNKMEN